jgi:hypothetical protein
VSGLYAERNMALREEMDARARQVAGQLRAEGMPADIGDLDTRRQEQWLDDTMDKQRADYADWRGHLMPFERWLQEHQDSPSPGDDED